MPIYDENEGRQVRSHSRVGTRQAFNNLNNKVSREVRPGAAVDPVRLNVTQQKRPTAPAFQVYVDPENRADVNDNNEQHGSSTRGAAPKPLMRRGRSFSTAASSGRTTMRLERSRRHSTPEGLPRDTLCKNQEPLSQPQWSNVTIGEDQSSQSGSQRSQRSSASLNRTLSNSSMLSDDSNDGVFSPYGYDEGRRERFTFDHCVYGDKVGVGASNKIPQRTRKVDILEKSTRSRSLGESTHQKKTSASTKNRRYTDDQRMVDVTLTPQQVQWIANAYRSNPRSGMIVQVAQGQINPRSNSRSVDQKNCCAGWRRQ